MRISTAITCLLVCVCAASRPLDGTELSDEQIIARLEAEQPRDRAIARALDWIRDQQRENGSLWKKRKHGAVMTAFGLMAHLAAGTTFHDVEHGPWMLRSLRYLLTMQSPDGYFGDKDQSRMYGHGIITLTLAESLGMFAETAPVAADLVPDRKPLAEQVRIALEKAVARTVWAVTEVKKKKQHRGGWRYEPDARDADLSLSGWQMMSLHACQQIGITVPEGVINAAADYGKRLTTKDGKVGYNSRGGDHPALRGLGMLCFAIAGNEEDELVDAIATRIGKLPISAKGGRWFFYRAYYDAVGLSRARPEAWEAYRPVLERVLLDLQHDAGYWRTPPGGNEGSYGRIYTTAMAVLALAVERHALPVYQR